MIIKIIIKNERLLVHTGDSMAGAAESSIHRMRRSPGLCSPQRRSGFENGRQVNKANTVVLCIVLHGSDTVFLFLWFGSNRPRFPGSNVYVNNMDGFMNDRT